MTIWGLMTPRDLRVNPAVVTTEGQELATEACEIPPIPEADTAVGADPLSTAFAAHMAATIDPLVMSRPKTQQQAISYAQALLAAAQMYNAADERIGNNLREQMASLPNAGRTAPASAGLPGRDDGGTG